MDIDKTTFKKMVFVYNAIETGWTVTKQDENTFIFKIITLEKRRSELNNRGVF